MRSQGGARPPVLLIFFNILIYLINFNEGTKKIKKNDPREEPGLQFPPLSARQKQFALNPGHPEYYRYLFIQVLQLVWF